MFDWDPRKAKSNRRKHGVSTAFLDPVGLDGDDIEHSEAKRGACAWQKAVSVESCL
jgi:uncharacterized DUF497 family protein